MSTNKNSIHILRGTKTKPNVSSTILYDGQLYFDRGTKTLQVGDKSNSTIGNNNNYVTVKDSAIVESKLDTGSVTTAKIRDRAINDAKIADDAAIKGSKLADANNTSSPSGITTSKIEKGAITTDKICDKAVTTSELADGAVTPEKLDSTKEYTVKNITANGNVIIQTERDEVTWAGAGMQYTKNNNYGGEILVPDRSMNAPETFATEEEIKRQIESGEIVAKNAIYAYVDGYSQEQIEAQGTIDERLKRLGFKTGSLEILADSKGKKPYVNLNLIRKEGNIVAIYYSGEGGRVDLDSTNLRRHIIGKIPNEFWPSTAADNNITELSYISSALSLVKFNNEWYIQSVSGAEPGIVTYNLNQPHNPISDAPFISNIPEIIVPEGSKATTVTQSVIDDFNWDSIEDIPYVLIASNTYIDITYDKSNGSVDRNSYSNAVLHDTSSGKDADSLIIEVGTYRGYRANLRASWNKSTKTISYTLTKYKYSSSSSVETTEGIATVKPSVTQIRNLKISPLDIFV